MLPWFVFEGDSLFRGMLLLLFRALMNVNNHNVAEYKFKTFLPLKVFSLTL